MINSLQACNGLFLRASLKRICDSSQWTACFYASIQQVARQPKAHGPGLQGGRLRGDDSELGALLFSGFAGRHRLENRLDRKGSESL